MAQTGCSKGSFGLYLICKAGVHKAAARRVCVRSKRGGARKEPSTAAPETFGLCERPTGGVNPAGNCCMHVCVRPSLRQTLRGSCCNEAFLRCRVAYIPRTGGSVPCGISREPLQMLICTELLF